MSDNRLRPASRPDTPFGVSDAAWGCAALWAGAATVLGAAAAAVEPIGNLGPGAAVLAGAGGASAAMLAIGASLWGGAAALGAWRGSKAPSAARPAASAHPGGDPILAELVSGLASRLARAEEKLDAAVAGGALPLQSPSHDGVGSGPGVPARAAEEPEQGREALRARIAAEAEAAERRSGARVDALAGALLPRLDRLDQDVAELRRASAEADARAREFEAQVFDLLRARDAGRLLRKLDAEASCLFDKLFDADERRYPTAEAWRADYAEWRARINAFWDVVRGYRTGVEQPFAVSEADVDGADAVPGNALFAAADMRFRHKMLVVVNERHLSFREGAFSFNAKKGSPPEPGAPVPSPARRPSLATG